MCGEARATVHQFLTIPCQFLSIPCRDAGNSAFNLVRGKAIVGDTLSVLARLLKHK